MKYLSNFFLFSLSLLTACSQKTSNTPKDAEKTKKKMRISFKNKDYSCNYKKVIQYDLSGNIIKEYISAKEAKTITGLKIQNALTGRAKQCGGYIWKYKI